MEIKFKMMMKNVLFQHLHAKVHDFLHLKRLRKTKSKTTLKYCLSEPRFELGTSSV